ncbi:MAG: YhdP family protein [Cellvibrionaceae bacterium]|nr:YhdP family protein [Cellvibrionaceae bacterium]
MKASWKRSFARRFWGLAAALLITLALVVQGGRLLLPMADNYRADIAQQLGQALGVRVELDQLQGEWTGLKPQLRIDGMRWYNQGDEQVMALGSLNLRIDLLRTLLNWRLSWSEFQIDELSLALQRFDDGQIYLQGVLPSPEDPDSDDVIDPLEFLSLRGRVELSSVNLRYQSHGAAAQQWQLPALVMENTASFHRLSAQLSHNNQPQLKFVFEAEGDPRDPETFLANAYLQLQQVSVAQLAEQFANPRWLEFKQRQMVESLELTGELWLLRLPGGYMELQGQLQASGGAKPLPQTLDLQLSAVRSAEQFWQINLQNIDAQFGLEGERQPLDIGLSFAPEQPLIVQLPELDLGYWYALSERFDWLPEGEAKKVLGILKPRGHLSNIHLSYQTGEQPEFLVRANVQDFAASAWQGAPALSGVSGYLQSSAKQGFFDIDSHGAFSMHYTTVYNAPQVFERARGQVRWLLARDENSIFVNSGPIQMQAGQTEVNGSMQLYTPWFANTEPSDLTLFIGLKNERVENYAKYLPEVVAPSLREWIAQAEASGRLRNGSFIYRGGLKASERLNYTTQLALSLEDISLNYMPDWPRVEGINAELQVDGSKLWLESNGGSVGGLTLAPMTVTLEDNPRAEGDRLTVAGRFSGPSQDGVKFLLDSPIAASVANEFADWRLDGQLSGAVDLKIPISRGVSKGSRYDIEVELADNSLQIPSLGMGFENIRSKLYYDAKRGLHSKKIEAKLWGQPLSGRLGPDKAGTALLMNGKLTPEALALWTDEPGFLLATGSTSVNARLNLPATALGATGKGTTSLQLSTDMSGLALNLPAPYGKAAADLRQLSLHIPLQGEGARDMDLRYYLSKGGPRLAQLLDSFGSAKRRFQLALNGAEPQGKWGEFTISGQLPGLDIEPWLGLPDQYQAAARRLARLRGQSGVAKPGLAQLAPMPVRWQLQLEQLQLAGLMVDNVSVSGRYQRPSDWWLEAHSEQLSGKLAAQGRAQPLQLRLLHLHLVESAAGSQAVEAREAAKTGADWDFSRLPATAIEIGQLTYNGQDLGQWQAQLAALGSGLKVDKIYGSLGDIRIGGKLIDAQDPGASLQWQRDGDGLSSLVAHIHFNDINELSQRWQVPSLMESEQAEFDLNMNWPGSPMDFNSELIAGSLDLAIDKGRFFQSAGAGGNALLRLLSVLNFDTWVRRLRLDFSDLYKEGIVFDTVRGHIDFQQQQLLIQEPILVKSPSSRMQLAGKIDWRDETLDTRLVATLPVGNNVALATGLLVSWPAAAGVYLASKIFSNQVDRVASVSYSMTGAWDEPQVKLEKLFDPKAAKKAGSELAQESQAPETDGIQTESGADVIEPGGGQVRDPNLDDQRQGPEQAPEIEERN